MTTTTARRQFFFVLIVTSATFLMSLLGVAQTIPLNEQRSQTKEKYVPGRVIVRFKSGRTELARSIANVNAGAISTKTFESFKDLQVVQVAKDIPVEQILKSYAQNPDVEYVEPDYRYYPNEAPNDPWQSLLWGMTNTGQSGGTAGVDIKMLQAWQLATGNKNIVVGILDTGTDYFHPDLLPNLFHNPNDCTFDYTDDDNNGFVDDCWGFNVVTDDPYDYLAHGTHVQGTIGAAGNNGMGVAGVNWSITLLPCKFIAGDGGSASGAIQCLDFIAKMKERGYNVVATNNSWGGYLGSRALADAIRTQADKGILFIAAAGNEALDTDRFSHFPSAYDLPNVISVAASDRTDQLASFSNYGKRSVDISAPGVGIFSTLVGQTYGYLSGTSMATPHVTGVAALLKSYNASLDWMTIRNLILASGDDAPMLGETLTGKRLNAFGALTCSGKEVLGRRMPRGNGVSTSIGGTVKISALHINCGSPAGAVNVQIEPGSSTVVLKDDGVSPDEIAGDGIYSASFVPSSGGIYTATLPDGDTFKIAALKSYQVSQTTYNYRNISGARLDMQDETEVSLATPFPIHFGGQTFDHIFIGDNGLISFDRPFNVAPAQQLPYYDGGAFVAPWWDDLAPVFPTDRNIFWEVIGTAPNRELVIEWRGVPRYPVYDEGSIKFQVVFFEDRDDVLFNYADTVFSGTWYQADHGGYAVSGIQISPTDASMYSSYGKPLLTDGLALLWRIAQPDFSITLDSQSATVYPGQTAKISGFLKSIYGFTDNVQVRCSVGAPSTCGSVTAKPYFAGRIFNIEASDTVPKQYAFDVIAENTSLGLSHSVPFTLNLVDILMGDPSMSELSVPNGGSATLNVQISAAGPFNGSVTMGCDNLPPGAMCTFAPSVIQPREGTPVNVTVGVTLARNTPLSDISLVIWAKGDLAPAAKTKLITAHVTANPDFIMVPGVAELDMAPSDTTSFNVELKQQDNYSKPVSLTCSVFPVGPTCSVVSSPVLVPGEGSITVNGNNSPMNSNYQINITGQDGTLSHSILVPLNFVDYTVVGPSSADAFPTFGAVTYTITPRSGYRGTLITGCDSSALPGSPNCSASQQIVTFTSDNPVFVSVTYGRPASVAGTFPLKLLTKASASGLARETVVPVTMRLFSFSVQGDLDVVLAPGETVTRDILVTPITNFTLPISLYPNCNVNFECSITPASVSVAEGPTHAVLSMKYLSGDWIQYFMDSVDLPVSAEIIPPGGRYTVQAENVPKLHPIDFMFSDPFGGAIYSRLIYVTKGHETSLTFKILQSGGQNIPVTVKCSEDLPPGATCRFDKSTVGANEETTVTIGATEGVPFGARSIDLTATGTINGQVVTHTFTLSVYFGSFELKLLPDTVSVPVGEEAVYWVTVLNNWLYDASGSATCTSSVPGVSCEAPLEAATGYPFAVTARSTPGLTPPGKHPIDIAMTIAGETHSVTSYLNVQGTDSIVLTAPNGQDLWSSGTQYITWRYTGDPGSTVKVELLKKGVLDRVLATKVPVGANGKGSYTWAIPDSLPFSQFYKVRVTSESKPSLTDESDDRVWVGRGVDINSPKSGAVVYNDAYLTVDYTWSELRSVKLDLYKAGTFIRSLAPEQVGGYFSGPNWHWSLSGSTLYDVPAGTDYTVKLIPTEDPSRAVMSEPFTVSKTTITVTSPKAREVYKPGDTLNVTWNWSGDPIPPGPEVSVVVSDGAYKSYFVARSTPLGANGKGAISWTIPLTAAWGVNYKVSVGANTGAGSAISDAFWVGEAYKVSVIPASNGQIQSLDYQIVCDTGLGTQCEQQFLKGTVVKLRALPDYLYEFKEWTGDCTGTGECTLTLNKNATVGAAFQPVQQNYDWTAAGPTSATVKAGSAATYNFKVRPTTQLASDITFSCENLPKASSCGFSPNSASRYAIETPTTLTITTTAQKSQANTVMSKGLSGRWVLSFLGLLAIGQMLLPPFAVRRKIQASMLLLLVFVCISCGGGGGSGGGNPVTPPPPVTQEYTPPGTYNVTVKATSTSVVKTIEVQLVVQ